MDEFDDDDEHNSSPGHHKTSASVTKWLDSSSTLHAANNNVANAHSAVSYTNRPRQHQAYPGPYQGPQGLYNTYPTATVPLEEEQSPANSHLQEHVRLQEKPQFPSFPSGKSQRTYPAGGNEEDFRRAIAMQQNSAVDSPGMDVKHEQKLAFKATTETTQAKTSPAHPLYTRATTTGANGNDMLNDENNITTRGTTATSSGPSVATPATTNDIRTHQFTGHHVKNITIVQLQQQQLQYKYSQPAPPVSEPLEATTSTSAVAKNSSSLGSEAANLVPMSSATTVGEATTLRPQAAAVGRHHSSNVGATTLQKDVASQMSKITDCNSAFQGLSAHSTAMDSGTDAGITNRPPETTDTATICKANNHATSEATANQLNDLKSIETTKKTVVEDSGRKELAQTSRAQSETEAAPNVVASKCDQMRAIPDVSNMSTPKRRHNNDSAFTDDMYRQSPVANMSSVFATAMTSLYGDLPLDTEPLAHAVFHMESVSSPVAAHSPRPSYPHCGPGGGGGGPYASHMMFPQFRASPARSPALSIGK